MDDKMKAKCYRLDYNELGLSTLCVEKDEEIERLKEEYVMLQNASDEVEEEKDREIERLNNIIKDIKSQLDYLETYSSKEDVFEDMKRRLDRIDKIIGSDKE